MAMGFSNAEKSRMLALKGVGKTVIARLEQIGFSSLEQLVNEDPLEITKHISQLMGSTCWHNSPQARGAITALVQLAKQRDV
jgi:nucleotidyltransferase/DNA polymerase involved in DNA repair